MWKPKEIIIHKSVKDDPATLHFLKQCQGVPVRHVDNGKPKTIKSVSEILSKTPNKMLQKIIAGKPVIYIAPAGTEVDLFDMPDDRILCPHFDRLKLASNGCFYQCDWCYLKLTYRATFPYITVKVGYDTIKNQLAKRLSQTKDPVIFNSGELADSLAMEHLTGAGREFIPWFANTANGHLFMLTKSDNVGDILNLEHKGRTIIAWSMNNDIISRKFEVGAPSFNRRLAAAEKVQKTGYIVRIRLDPIVPFDGWEKAYAGTIKSIFDKVSPERITLGTLRFEKGFYNMRKTIFSTGTELPEMLDNMEPMFEPKLFKGTKTPKIGKYSFSEERRIEIFNFVIDEIRKHSNCKIALCKESARVWNETGLELSKCSCACQLDYANMLKPKEKVEKGVAMTKKSDLDIIKGSTNILLIAPHGHDKDDKNTGKLVRLIAKKSGSYAIINEIYRKPDDDNPESKSDKRVNLNHLLQVKKHLKKEFLDHILKYKNEIVKIYGRALIFWIHGVDDDNLRDDIPKAYDVDPGLIKILIGWGQKRDRNRHTAKHLTLTHLRKTFYKNELNTVLANPDKKVNRKQGIVSYCGWDIKNMNQLFRVGKYKDKSVESFQLEFRMTGCRDSEKSLKSTTKSFGDSISTLIIPVLEKNPVVPEVMEDKQVVEYEPLVEKAYTKLANIFSKNYERALMEAGQYIVRTFYGGEENIENKDYDKNFKFKPDVIENARNNNSPLDGTLRQLYQKIINSRAQNTPSQAWIYNSVNLVVQWQDMKKELSEKRFYTYRNLLLSHKIVLLQVKKIEDKKAFIKQIQEHELSVRNLKKLVSESKKKPRREKNIYSIIKDPDELFSDKYSEKFKLKELNNIRIDKLKKIKAKMLEECENTDMMRRGLLNVYETYNLNVEKYLDLLTDIKTVIDFKQNLSKDKKLVKSRTKFSLP